MSLSRIMLVVVIGAAAVLSAQTSEPATTAAPGVMLTIESAEGSDPIDVRKSRLIALAVPEGEPVSPFVPPGPFQARFEGFINIKIRGDYIFTAHGTGDVELLISDQKVVLGERVRLRKGSNSFLLRYTPPGTGDAVMRLYWAERDKPAGPVPPDVLTHDASDSKLIEHSMLREGRELFLQLRCAKCHTVDSPVPEIHADAPALSDAGSRYRAEWMARWIHDPKSLRSDATMPRVFHSEGLDSRAADIAAYLATLGTPPATDLQFSSQQADAGGRLFLALGCIACHSFDADRVSLAGLKQKWHTSGLVDYLQQPHRHYKWNPMPDFALSDEEARQLAAFIVSRDRAEPVHVDFSKADVERGRELVSSSGCLNCHPVHGQNQFEAPALKEPAAGCLGEEAGAAPDFKLTADERDALKRFLELGRSSLGRDTSEDFASRQIRQLNCIACHTLDQQTDTWSSLKGEIEAIEKTLPPAADELAGDQSRPTLTWAGEKLHADWMTRFIEGKIEHKPRPWLAARMPAFPARAKLLAEGMAREHGVLPDDDQENAIDDKLAAIGRGLVGKERGFSCVTCHAVGSAPAISPFEAFGPNFAHTTARMRKDFYHRWAREPLRYEPGTRMPQYADLEGKTSFREILDGDAERQFEAIWQYLRQGERISSPK